MQHKFIEATKNECVEVAAFAAKAFADTFGHLYRPENLAAHLEEKFSAEHFVKALEAGNTIVLLKEKDALIGYAKVGQVEIPVKGKIPKGAQEFHRVYIDRPHQGKGLGKVLMLHILSLPRITTAPVVYLGVWEENRKAQALYEQYGFEPVGNYLYHVGDQTDREIIMARVR